MQMYIYCGSYNCLASCIDGNGHGFNIVWISPVSRSMKMSPADLKYWLRTEGRTHSCFNSRSAALRWRVIADEKFECKGRYTFWAILQCDVIYEGENWVNCAVLTGNSAGLRTCPIQSSFTHTQNCTVHSGNPTVPSVYLPHTTIPQFPQFTCPTPQSHSSLSLPAPQHNPTVYELTIFSTLAG